MQMASLAPLGVPPPASVDRRASSAPTPKATVVRASSATKDDGAQSDPAGARSALGHTKQRDLEQRKKEVSPADPTEPCPRTAQRTDNGSSMEGAQVNTGCGRPSSGEKSIPEKIDDPDRDVEHGEGDEQLDAQEELLAPGAVLVAFPNPSAITREPLVSMVNSEGYSIVSKSELTAHFLPPGWVGTVIVKPGESDEAVRLSPAFDPDGGDYLW